jgi:hypothetical protein
MADATQTACLARIVASLKRRQTLAQRSSSQQFLLVGDVFRVGDETWTGPVIASPDALFLFQLPQGYTPDEPRELLDIPRDPADLSTTFITMSSDLLPSAITGHPDWPVGRTLRCQVIVLPREDVQSIHYQLHGPWLDFSLATHPVVLRCESEDPAIAADFLARTGWTAPRIDTESSISRRQLATLAFAAAFMLLLFVSLSVTFSSYISSQSGMLVMVFVAGGFAALLYGVLHIRLADTAAWSPEHPESPYSH